MKAALDRLEADAGRKPQHVQGIHPHLVFRIPVAAGTSPTVLTDRLQELGIAVVSIEHDGAIIAFRDNTDLSTFKDAVNRYQRGPGINPNTKLRYKSTKYDVFEIIEAGQMRLWGRVDRIGSRLAAVIGPQGDRVDSKTSYVLDVDLWHRGTAALARDSLSELERLIEDKAKPGERLSDSFVGDMLCLARACVSGEKLGRLLDMDAVAEVDVPPQPVFDNYAAFRKTPRDFPSPPKPAVNGPRVCILDSGITSGHKLLANNVGHEEAILTTVSSPADANGHGTMVGGIAVFGNVRACYEAGTFASPITLFSARLLNDRNRFDDDKRIITQMRDAIRVFFAEPYNCRVFNLSLGSPDPLLTDSNKRQGSWAEALDVIAREFKVLLVVSAGNHVTPIATITSKAEAALVGYPDYLFDPAAQLCDPATAAIPITVGALAEHDVPEVRHSAGKDDIIRPLAKANEPTPSTRIGPGVNDAIKPEFVSYGGNDVFQGFRQVRETERIDRGVAVMSFSHEPAKHLFAFNVGTSFAAPRVAHLAALVWDRIRRDFGQDPDPNLVRAVLATAAVRPEATCSLVEATKGPTHIPAVCGYGIPDPDLALESGDRRVTLVAQGRITIDNFQIYQIPVPAEFQEDGKTKRIIVAMAFDPPVRRRRAQYLGVDMCCYLFRNKSVEDIIEAYRAITPEERKSKSVPSAIQGSCKCEFTPTPRSLATSTLHRYEWVSRRKLQADDTFYLLVRADRNWAAAEVTEQDFAVAVTLDSNDPRLYGVIRERIPVLQRTRLRQIRRSV
jgi:subtilisin family serine protease